MDRPKVTGRVGLWRLAEALAGLAGAVVAPVVWALDFLFRRDAPELSLQWERVRPGWRRLWIVAAAIICASSVAMALALWFRTLFGVVAGIGSPPDIRATLLIVAAVVGAPFVVWRTILAAQQTRINQQTHFTTRFAKAVELLGADKTEKRRVEKSPATADAPPAYETVETTVPNIEVRLGAIYALERIMKQSPDDYWPIVSTLCAYVRQNATFREEPTDEVGSPIPEAPELLEDDQQESAEDREVRLAVIRTRAVALRSWGERMRLAATKRGAASLTRPDIGAALAAVANRSVRLRIEHEGVRFDSDPPDLPLGQIDLSHEAAETRTAFSTRIWTRLLSGQPRTADPTSPGPSFMAQAFRVLN